MLARLQRFTTLALWALALVTLAWFAADGRGWLGVVAAILVLFAYSFVLAFEMALVYRVNRDDPSPPARVAQLVGAWWGEVRAAWQVFCWRQPFREHAEPDVLPPQAQGRRGIVFVHGFVCNRAFWNPWIAMCRARGIPCIAVNLEPVFGGVDAYAPIVDAAVTRLSAHTGMAPALVCHSMGGLAARAWLRQAGARARVHHVVTIGTPHHGTWLARWGLTRNSRQMRRHSRWLLDLEQDEARETEPYRHFTCFYGHADNIVFPASTACLPGADNRFVPGTAHVAMAFRPDVMLAAFAQAGV